MWWCMQGCSKHCQSPSDLPKSRESGPERGDCLLTPVPWETEIWDMSLPIISFTEKQEKGEWLVTSVWQIIWCSMPSSISKTFFSLPQFSIKVKAVLEACSWTECKHHSISCSKPLLSPFQFSVCWEGRWLIEQANFLTLTLKVYALEQRTEHFSEVSIHLNLIFP